MRFINQTDYKDKNLPLIFLQKLRDKLSLSYRRIMNAAESMFFRFLLGLFIGSLIGTMLPIVSTLYGDEDKLCPPDYDPKVPINLDQNGFIQEDGISLVPSSRTQELRKTREKQQKSEENKNQGKSTDKSKDSFHATASNHAEGETRKRGFAYVGMLSTDTLIRTRGLSAAETWAQDMNKKGLSSTAKLEIYADSDFQVPGTGVKVIKMPGVADNVYPPQKKSFSAIKYMADHYIDQYEWFVRFDDDAYLNWELLETFLRGIDSNQPYFIGAPGYGKDQDDYVEEGMNYCMGGPGIVFSREALRRLGPHLGSCLRNLLTEHEDVELGRCVHTKVHIGCTNAWEAHKLFWQNFKKADQITSKDLGYFKNIVDLEPEVLKKAVSYHANKDMAYQYRLYVNVLKSRIDTLQTENTKRSKMVRDINFIIDEMDEQNSVKKRKTVKTQDVYSTKGIDNYKFIQVQRGHIYRYRREDECNRKVEEPWVDVISNNVREAAKYVYKDRHLLGKITKIEVPLIYHTTTSEGAHYIADIAMRHLRYNGYHGTAELSTIKARVHMSQTYGRDFIGEQNSDDIDVQNLKMKLLTVRPGLPKVDNRNEERNLPVHFIVPFSGRPDNLVRFLKYYKEELLDKGHDMHLVIVLFITGEDDEGLPFVQENLERVRTAHPNREFMLIKVTQDFNRGKGLQIGANSRSNNDLFVFMDVDMIYDENYVRRIRRNTVQGQRVYYPVFLSEYNPAKVYNTADFPMPDSHFQITERHGYWRYYSYGMVAIYKSDFDATGGFDLSIEGWGLEDLRLAGSCLDAKLHILRTVDESLIHVFHDKFCDPELDEKQMKDCIATKASHYGPKIMLYGGYKRNYTSSSISHAEIKV